MKLPSIPFLIKSFIEALKRFPFVMIAAFFGVVISMVLIEIPYDHDKESLFIEILMATAFALPLTLSAGIITEKKGLSGILKWMPSIAAILLAVVYFLLNDISDTNYDEKVGITFTGLLLVAHLLVSFIAFMDKTSVEDFWEFNRQLFSNFIIGASYCLVIFAGLSIAIVAIDNLFDLNIDDNVYQHLFVFIAGVLNTTYFLSNFPEKYEGLSEAEGGIKRAFVNFSKFILIPIVLIYFLILYAYSFKILGIWELPKGWVSSLVLGFSVAGIFTYLLNYMLVHYDAGKLVHKYRKWFFYVLAPMVVLLFVAIGRRMGDYGVTEPRYVVATLGVWLLIVSLYFIFSKKDNIKFIPISLSIFALISILGPFNMFSVSEKSQVGRLEELLTKNNLLQNGIVVPAKDALSGDDLGNINSIINYLRYHGHFQSVAPWFGLEDDPEYSVMNEKLESLGLNENDFIERNHCNIYFDRPLSVNTTGYEKLIFPQLDFPVETLSGIGMKKVNDSNIYEILDENGPLDRIDFTAYITYLNEKYNCADRKYEVEDARFEISGEKYDVMLITEWMEYNIEEGVSLGSWRGSLLLREKQ